ncbi:MAG TPA: aspartyl protease family protein [Kofleriaceae bacterium]|nr:aspartyl protease family protein [Kofleriaceae bacterium]
MTAAAPGDELGYCVNHPAVLATGRCDDCKRAICNRCTKGTLDGFMCPPCAHRRYGRQKLVTGLKVGALVAAMVGVGAFGVMVVGRGADHEHGPPDAKPETADDIVVEELRKQRDQTPCEQALVRKLVTELNRQERYADAVDDAQAYLAKCDEFPRLRWDLMYALEHLERYPEAIKQATILLTRDPYDSDFWWWRGEDRAKVQQPLLALADYRQSFANSEDAGGSRFAAARILDVVDVARRPCEGVAALHFFEAVHGGELDDTLRARADELDRTGRCAGLRGTGKLALPSLAKGPVRVKVKLGGVEGRFQLDERCGTTVLARAFAARAGVVADGPAIDSVAAGAIRSGPTATVDVDLGAAKAPAVDVAVVDELPDQIDGVIGLSLLWKFELDRRDDGGLTLTAP